MVGDELHAMRWRMALTTVGLLGAVGSPAVAQQNKFDLSARVVGLYDSNTLRFNSARFSGARNNYSVSPQLGIDYDRNFARQHVFVNGTAGYVYNSRFDFLNRELINLTGGANLRFGARCQIDPTITYFRSQSDLEDIGGAIRNTASIQDYAIEAACPRRVGLSPTIGGELYKVDNSSVRRNRDQTITGGRFGLSYRRPSLGDAELYVQVQSIDRARRFALPDGPTRDRSDVTAIGLRLRRSVGTRISADGSIAYTRVTAKASVVPDFSGLTYGASVTYAVVPGTRITGSFNRAVSARGNLGASYFIIRNATIKADARLSARTSVGAQVQLARRQFRAEDVNTLFGPRGIDRQFTVSADASYRIARPLVLTAATRYRKRDSTNDFYDYSSFQAMLGAAFSL